MAGPMDDPDYGGAVAPSGGFKAPQVFNNTQGPGAATARTILADNPGMGAARLEAKPGGTTFAQPGEDPVTTEHVTEAQLDAGA